jgi:hypothetical protein
MALCDHGAAIYAVVLVLSPIPKALGKRPNSANGLAYLPTGAYRLSRVAAMLVVAVARPLGSA